MWNQGIWFNFVFPRQISSFLASELNLSPGIAELNLRGNRISVMGDAALSGLWSLTSLDLASNLLTAIPLDFFKDSTHLQKLYLENNTLSALAPDTFSGLGDLLLLNMSRNALTSHNLNEAIFASLTKVFTYWVIYLPDYSLFLNLTEIRFINSMGFGNVLWNGCYH